MTEAEKEFARSLLPQWDGEGDYEGWAVANNVD